MSQSRKEMTTGSMISALCFGGVGLAFVDAALAAEGLRAWAIGLCALACLVAALFPLWQRFVPED